VKRTAGILAGVTLMVLVGSVLSLAMFSAHFRLDWFTPGTSGGGGPATSANNAVNLTVGQSAIGTSSSTHYRACLGYWCGVAAPYRVYLPLLLRGRV
jgi:hypothetical protein